MSTLTKTQRVFAESRAATLDDMSGALYAMATTLRSYGYDAWADKLGDVAWETACTADDIEAGLGEES